MTARIRELSRCPHCRARGVKLYEPLRHDGYDCDVPYCGQCGRNYPSETTAPTAPRDNVRPMPSPKDAA